MKKCSIRSKNIWRNSYNLSSSRKRNSGVKVAKEVKDVNVVKEENLKERMVITLPIMKREVKIQNPQEIMNVEVS